MNEFFKNMSPKSAFLVGVVGGVMAICTVGFLILLVSYVNGVSFTPSATAPTAVNNAVAQPTTNDQAPAATVGTIAPVSSSDHILGDPKAPVVIVEYSDTECPFCKQFHTTLQQVYSQNNGEVAWVYRHFPLASLHSKAPHEAEATECAAELGGNDGFWKYLDELFSRTTSNNTLDESALPEIASAAGLDVNAFNKCLSSGKYTQKVQDQYDEAIAAGGTGTPYSVIIANGQKTPVNGAVPISQLQSIIDSAKTSAQQ
ncbi:disulfide bond formation protein DsbA [Candidatus Uhrbacteria bacterium CG10_big_fil_rev_8_21_14_0_10_48_11]|uniref:Disulfide bond formation protein DsbA n=1 Tax=Candidatus Uhrbacteria bacterium CG10_big_fil_rev_8_21_14_0_10_48_11 TaxID=1975037 RepID=A0A2M8LEJ4_9BACT|nr:MAG: disulfide bond formation protein DsbA [Candidatus Uhrbacteria bacterium CG10_big_fil_rev_8_21_14_0_10_48_11]